MCGAPANSTDLFSKACGSARVARVRTASKNRIVLASAQVKYPFRVVSTDSTDIYRLSSRVEIPTVSPGRLSPSALCGADIRESVLSVLVSPVANAAGRRAP
ncbi:hypothetical protein I5H06_gp33 [Mycobacterium phage SirPhilip]|uniref:Uncharacterized protein n=1 Tax=Mycobacterium phage SirPhilip TaxID=2015824 RepID=A0A222ZM67_9CAUD|nr:hypothetical protein I5H06_gp33 [Mycobacterium phage SirPhilip]ASR85271.1 hypothetical protein SEA_SIRPHILIP_69 [Mycobacterium phage SirPhilip]